jgi:hypothetical protein
VTAAEASEDDEAIPTFNFDPILNSNMHYLKDTSRPIRKEKKKKHGNKKSKKHRRA